MKLKPVDSVTDPSPYKKEALPYTEEERRTYDGEEDIERILATMERYLKSLKKQKEEGKQ